MKIFVLIFNHRAYFVVLYLLYLLVSSGATLSRLTVRGRSSSRCEAGWVQTGH
jgi:hypothetical protein